MEERKIYRGCFVNFMTGKVDSSLARGTEYSLKIIEGENSYFYHVRDGCNAKGSPAYRVKEPKKFVTSVLTDWTFLQEYVQNCHILTMYPHSNDIFVKRLRGSSKDLTYLDSWAEQFCGLLPKDLVLRLYEELDYPFQKLEWKRSYKQLISKEIYQIDEFQIDSDWYLYLGRTILFNHAVSDSFQYNLKYCNIVRKEQKEFKKNLCNLKTEFTIPDQLVSALLRACRGDVNLCTNILQDIIGTRKRSFSCQLADYETFYRGLLASSEWFYKNWGFEHFIKDWKNISDSFRYYSQSLQNELSNFMLGK